MNTRIATMALSCAAIAAIPTSASSDVPPSAASVLVVPPGRIDRAVATLDGLAQDMMRKTGVPGMAIAVVHDGRVVYLKGLGVRKEGTTQRVDADTRFELASVSKPVGAAVVAAAIGKGVVAWTDPLTKYLPDFTLSDPYVGRTVTIADMYAHRSGLPDHAGDLLEDIGYGRTTIIQRLKYYRLAPFRISYAYTNFGLTAGGEAAAHAAHMSWEQLSHDLLYAPLGMTSTSSRFSDFARSPNHASLHFRVGSAWKALYVRNADAQSPAGGVSSSARDMARFLEMELAEGAFGGKQIVDREALLASRNPAIQSSPLRTPDSRASFYGYGIGVGYDSAGRLRLSHSGAFGLGAATIIVMLPSEHLGIVILVNATPVGAPEALAEQFLDRAEFGESRRDWLAYFSPFFERMMQSTSSLAGKTPPPNAAAAMPAQAYVGTYKNALYGDATVEQQGERLKLILGPKKMAFPLIHWAGNEYAYMPPGENGGHLSAVTFAVPSGSSSAASVTLENMNAEKLGTFKR